MAVINTRNPEEVALCKEALKAASASQLYHIIRDICSRVPAAIPIVSDHLLMTEDEVALECDYDDLYPDVGSASESKSTSKSNPDAGSGISKGEGERERSPENGILEVIPPKAAAAKKRLRLRPRYAVCVNCKTEYDVTQNWEESCYHHPEPLEPIDDEWAETHEHDEWMYGDVNEKYWWEKYPERFIYPCCGQNYGDEECEVDWHVEDASGRKRRKY